MDMNDDVNAAMESISSPSSAAELSAGEEENTEEAMEEGEVPSKDNEEEEEGEEGEILSDSDEEGEQGATEATNETTSKNKSDDGLNKGSSQDHSSRDGRRSPLLRDGYQYRRHYRYSGHSQSSSSSSHNTTSSSGNTSSNNHTARRGVKRPASNDRRAGTDVRNRKEGSPFMKRKPKMKAPPPSNSPFWGERKHLLPTPSVSPRTGYNLDSDYPQLPRRLVKEYFPDPPIRFVRDSHNFPPIDHNKSDNLQSSNKPAGKDKDSVVTSPPATSNEEEVEDIASQECEVTVPSLPSMQDLVKNQMFADGNSEMETLPPPLIEGKSLETSNTLADVFSEDFPLLDGETPEQEETISLKRLVAGRSGNIDITIVVGEQKVLLLLCV